MKQITQERLLRVINKIDAALSESTGFTRQTEIIKALSRQGLQSACGCNTELDGDRLKVELNYWESPRTENDFLSLLDSWQTKIDHYNAKREKVWSIQEKYRVSGLIWSSSDFDPLFPVPWVDESLNLIDADLAILSEHKSLHLQKWIDCLRLQDCSFYRWAKQAKQNEWKPLSVADLLSISPYYQWCHTWNHSEIFYLLLGNDKDTDSIESDTTWFCATKPNVRPHY